jgi:hypothetical protein
MKMSDVWYEEVEATTVLMQGDLIPNCPLVSWKAERPRIDGNGETEMLRGMTEVIQTDTVVMTQACDLEQGGVVITTISGMDLSGI